jgi:hypothetical protein
MISAAAHQEELKVFADRMIRQFTIHLRLFVVEKIKEACSDAGAAQKMQEAIKELKLRSDDPECWDLAALVAIFKAPTIESKVFRRCFDETGFKRATPYLMQIKELRNKLAHEISVTMPLSARHIYSVSETICQFFELMTCPIPAVFHEEFWKTRL